LFLRGEGANLNSSKAKGYIKVGFFFARLIGLKLKNDREI